MLIISLAATPVCAQWKWRDAQGRTQYSDRPPPPSVPAKDILQHPPGQDQPPLVVVSPMGAAGAASASASAPAPTAKGRQTEASIESQRREAAAAEEAQRTAELARLAKQQGENCQRARDYARSLESGVRIARVDANGERAFLDDTQRAQELGKAREVITSDCK
jgi:hypothetical protein